MREKSGCGCRDGGSSEGVPRCKGLRGRQGGRIGGAGVVAGK